MREVEIRGQPVGVLGEDGEPLKAHDFPTLLLEAELGVGDKAFPSPLQPLPLLR